jgi:hypothetical protein
VTDYSGYTDKKVKLQLTDGTVLEGTIEAGSTVGVVLKEKGQRSTKLIEAKDIQSLGEVEAAPKKLKARTLPLVTEGKVREHLIERHGLKVSEIDALTEEQAKAFHDTVDHSDLGHKHRAKTEAELAIEQAAADASEDGE